MLGVFAVLPSREGMGSPTYRQKFCGGRGADEGTQLGRHLVAVDHQHHVFQKHRLLLHLIFGWSELFTANYAFHLVNVQQILK